MKSFQSKKTVSAVRFLEHSEVVAETLPADLPDFTAFDPIFTEDYVTQIQQASDNARAVPTDEILVDQLGGKTQNVKTALKDCYQDYETIAYYVVRAFKGNLSDQGRPER